MKIIAGLLIVSVFALASGCANRGSSKLGDGKLLNYPLPKELPGESLLDAAGYGAVADLYRAYMGKTTAGTAMEGYDYTITLYNAEGAAVDLTGWRVEEVYKRASLVRSIPDVVATVQADAAVTTSNAPSVAPGSAKELLEKIGGAK